MRESASEYLSFREARQRRLTHYSQRYVTLLFKLDTRIAQRVIEIWINWTNILLGFKFAPRRQTKDTSVCSVISTLSTK